MTETKESAPIFFLLMIATSIRGHLAFTEKNQKNNNISYICEGSTPPPSKKDKKKSKRTE